MMAARPKQYDDDDGRVICNMDVDGMPWHDKRIRREKKEQQRVIAAGQTDREQMTKAEARQFTFHAILAGMLIALVFSAAWVLFILFCTQIWFR
jgi:hypothetical protein